MATSTQVGDSFQAEVLGLDESASGMVELAEGDQILRVHLAGALPGERVRGRITYRSVHARAGRREAWGTLETVDRPSPERVAPVCPAHGRCGGCSLMHMRYSAQLEWKRARVCEAFAACPELAGLAGTAVVEVSACVPSPAVVGYRNQAKYVLARAQDGALVLGAYAPRSHDVIDLAGCQVVEPVLDEARQVLLGILSAHAVEPFHEVRRTGLLRYVMLRANRAGRVLATLVVARPDWAEAEAVAAECMQKLPALAGVVLNVNGGAGNVLLADDERLLAGQPTFADDIGEVQVRLASRSFFQANRAVGSCIYRNLVGALPGHLQRAVDAYSGAGGIALSLLARARQVIAIENNPAATRAASASTEQRLRVITADAAEGLATVEAAELVVLNPPRKGCSADVLAQVQRLSPGLLAYVSCDPESLARDLSVLVKAGATVVRVVPYDMMPHTPHVETLVLAELARR